MFSVLTGAASTAYGRNMPRLATIAIDSSQTIAPAQWSASWVQRRLIEAYSVERRLPQPRRRLIFNAWPKPMVEWTDIVGRADTVREEVLQSWEYANLGVSAEELTRMDDAQDWMRVILAPYPEERRCLSQWATAISYRRSVRRLLVQRGWSRTTFYRYVTAGAHIVAMELRRQGQPVV
jgi:hypothetical protein